MIRTLLLTLLFSVAVAAQTETLTNQTVIEMSRTGLSSEIIVKKITSSKTAFDVSASGLIELKKAGVDDSIIATMMERADIAPASPPAPQPELPFSEAPPTAAATPAAPRSIAFVKSSLQPSRQALEKELMKRPEFKKLNLSILRYKEQADLFVEIGYVSGSWITHRYVYRIYDRRSGAVLGAGETTSWGSLAKNLARNISQTLVSNKSS